MRFLLYGDGCSMNSHYGNLQNPPGSSIFQIIKWIWNTLFHQIVAVITIYAIWIPIEHYRDAFSWHVILCTLGVIQSLKYVCSKQFKMIL